MISETVAATPTKKWRFHGDMADIVDFARKLSQVKATEEIADRDVLLALLLSNRMFSSVDAYLKQAKVSPKKAAKRYQELLKSTANNQPQCEKTVFEKAEHVRETEPHLDSKDEISVAHTLIALADSTDPIVSQWYQEYGLSAQVIREAVIQSKSGDGFRLACFLTRELAEVLIFVIFFLIIIKSFLGELRLIPSESMVPTLAVDDRIVIERLTTWFRPTQRKDIMVFYPPMTQLKNDPWSLFLRMTGFSGLLYKKEDNIDVAYIKRLVGLPGDVVDVRPNIGVVVNGKLLDEPYVREKALTCTLAPKFVAVPNNPKDSHRTLFLGESGVALTDLEIWQFELQQGVLRHPKPIPKNELSNLLKNNSLDYAEKACIPIEVPKGYYYLMGDNRNESLDSRYWGFEPTERVIGRAVFRLWPLNRISNLTQ